MVFIFIVCIGIESFGIAALSDGLQFGENGPPERLLGLKSNVHVLDLRHRPELFEAHDPTDHHCILAALFTPARSVGVFLGSC